MSFIDNLLKIKHDKYYYLDPGMDEDKCRQLAKKALYSEDEKLAKKMIALIEEVKNSHYVEDSEAFIHCQEIGNFLCSNGGHWRMVLVARRVEVLAGFLRECELVWDGICDWMY